VLKIVCFMPISFLQIAPPASLRNGLLRAALLSSARGRLHDLPVADGHR
jgi:hypothetical protein